VNYVRRLFVCAQDDNRNFFVSPTTLTNPELNSGSNFVKVLNLNFCPARTGGSRGGCIHPQASLRLPAVIHIQPYGLPHFCFRQMAFGCLHSVLSGYSRPLRRDQSPFFSVVSVADVSIVLFLFRDIVFKDDMTVATFVPTTLTKIRNCVKVLKTQNLQLVAFRFRSG
jgi:hypothetical protein